MMGGRAAEEILSGEDQISTGCSNDLQKATNLGYQYVKHLGMHKMSLINVDKNMQVSD